jgi:hypothetical protein
MCQQCSKTKNQDSFSQIGHSRGQVVVGAIACTNNITQQKFKPIVTKEQWYIQKKKE